MDGPCGLLKYWIWSLAFQKYMDGLCGLHFVTPLVPSQQKGFSMFKLETKCVIKCKPQRPSMYFWKKLGTKALQSANNRDHLCTFEKLGTKPKILINHRDHPCN
ncbi:hypothetical protein Hanom_Chr03g00276711 [Helianthus anomalus]